MITINLNFNDIEELETFRFLVEAYGDGGFISEKDSNLQDNVLKQINEFIENIDLL